MSQLGYMFLALGVGAWSGAIFHLVTHAFFKSLLFLAAGVVILAMNHEHDIFGMGGLARKTPYTFLTFLLGALALTALPPTTAGFASKELILSRVWESGDAGPIFWVLGVLGVFVTSAYTFRLIFTVFGGKPREAAGHGAHGGAQAGASGKARAGRGQGRQAGRDDHGTAPCHPRRALHCRWVSRSAENSRGKPLPDPVPGYRPASRNPRGEMPLSTDSILQLVSEAASLLGIPAGWLISRRAVRAAASRTDGEARPAFVRYFSGRMGFDWLMTGPSSARSWRCGRSTSATLQTGSQTGGRPQHAFLPCFPMDPERQDPLVRGPRGRRGRAVIAAAVLL